MSLMSLEDFKGTLSSPEPPPRLTGALMGLWWDAKGNWQRAHEAAQEDPSPAGSWVHAYLHRKEGDDSNAAYWYNQAHQSVCREALESEWLAITGKLLEQNQ